MTNRNLSRTAGARAKNARKGSTCKAGGYKISAPLCIVPNPSVSPSTIEATPARAPGYLSGQQTGFMLPQLGHLLCKNGQEVAKQKKLSYHTVFVTT